MAALFKISLSTLLVCSICAFAISEAGAGTAHIGVGKATQHVRTRTTLCVANLTGTDIKRTELMIDGSDSWPDARRSLANGQSYCIDVTLPFNGAWPFKLTTSFTNDRTLALDADQHDAQTSLGRPLPASGTASNAVVVYQIAGSGTNALYLRSTSEPDNSDWMGRLLALKPSVALNELTMPGSHDAGMYEAHDCTNIRFRVTTVAAKDGNIKVGHFTLPMIPGVYADLEQDVHFSLPKSIDPTWTVTQSRNIYDQLRAGSRYFDLRVYRDRGNELRIGHFGGMGGCYGPKLATVLDDVSRFLALPSARREAVILKFSHTMSDSGENTPSVLNDIAANIVRMTDQKLGNLRFKSDAPGFLTGTALRKLSGHVVTLFDQGFAKFIQPAQGVFEYRSVPDDGRIECEEDDILPERNCGLPVYDDYSNRASYGEMARYQYEKLNGLGGYRRNYLFLLSWTVTPRDVRNLDVKALSARANPWLPLFAYNAAHELERPRPTYLFELGSGDRKPVSGKPNIVYWDFVDPYVNQYVIAINDGLRR